MSAGPWAGRPSAACHNVEDSGLMPLPESRGCAAQSSNFVVPGPLVRLYVTESPLPESPPPDSSTHDVFSSAMNSSVTLSMPIPGPSLAPSPQPLPPGPSTVNLSDCVSMPVDVGNWASPTQMAPLECVCIKRSECEQSGVAQDPRPRDSTQNSQMFKGAGDFGKSGDDGRAA